jgi:single-stranded DNA-binding protein
MSAGDTTLTITGNLTADPNLRYTGTGVPVAAPERAQATPPRPRTTRRPGAGLMKRETTSPEPVP